MLSLYVYHCDMCGISGSVNFSFNPVMISKVMGHRGPDARATFEKDNVLLHHLRLSIVDIAGGSQPMHYLDRYSIIFNGEIYNHHDIRRDLQLNCQTGSDTETLLQAWHKEGSAMLDRLDGMFAFAIYDNTERQLFIVRDRAGKKPVYYYCYNNQFAFASELNALRAILPLEADNEKIAGYIRIGSFFGSNTPYINVKELLSGSYIKIDTANFSLEEKKWWSISQFYQKPVLQISENDALNTLDELLQKAVKCRMESSDLEVGTFLSGGIDSGLITAIAANLHPRLKTFTVSFEGTYNEAPLARLVAEKYKTNHQEIAINLDNLLQDVEGIIAQYGEPFFDSSAIPSWYVCKAASEYLTVILNGDGADELFGGYRRHVPFAVYNFFKPSGIVRSMSSLATRFLPPGNEKKSGYNYFYRLLSLAGKEGISTYLSSWTDIFEGFEQHLLYKEEYMTGPEAFFKKVSSTPISGLRQMMWLDFDVSLFGALLVKMDIASMAHSLEGRSPMLSKDLLEWAPMLPDHLKIKGRTTKHLLRKAAEKYLPQELIYQPKRGFEIPLKQWVNHELKDLINSYLSKQDSFYPTFIKKNFVLNLVNNRVQVSAEKRAKMLWALFCLEVWYFKCLKQG